MAQTLDAAKRLADMQAMIESEDMTEEELADTLEGVEMELTDKIDAICALISDFKGNAQQCKDKYQALQVRQKMWENKAEGIRRYLLMCVQAANRKSIKTVFNTVSLRNGRDKLVINIDALPDEFKSVKVVVSADHKKIDQAIAEGVSLEGVTVEPGQPSIAIR